MRPPASSCEHRLRRILRRFLRRLQKRTPGDRHARKSQVRLPIQSGRARGRPGWLGDALKIEVMAPPEKGKANEAVIEILAERLEVGTDDSKVVRGHSSPSKVVAVSGVDDEVIKKAVG